MKKPIMHYAKYSHVRHSACGLFTFGFTQLYFDQKQNKFIHIKRKSHYMLEVTRTKKKVTCKNCLRTKAFKKK